MTPDPPHGTDQSVHDDHLPQELPVKQVMCKGDNMTPDPPHGTEQSVHDDHLPQELPVKHTV